MMLHRLGRGPDTGNIGGNCCRRGAVGSSHIIATVQFHRAEAREECMWYHFRCMAALVALCCGM